MYLHNPKKINHKTRGSMYGIFTYIEIGIVWNYI